MSIESFAGTLALPAGAIAVAAAKGLVLFALAFVAARALRHSPAATRHAVWAAALGAQLLLLLGAPVMPRLEVPPLPVSWDFSVTPSAAPTSNTKAEPTSAVEVKSVAEDREPSAESRGPQLNRSQTPAAAPRFSATAFFALAWLLGSLLVLLRYTVGTARVSRLARRSERVDDGRWLSLATRTASALGIDRPLTLRKGSDIDVPVTWGVVYPVVLLPRDADEWPEDRRQFVLVHEMAHVKRFDALMQLVAQLAIAIFWFNPFVWYAAHRIRIEREHACDDQVLLHGTRASYYADELLDMVRHMGRRNEAAPAFAALAMARRSEFEGRMLAILDARAPRRPLTGRVSLATLGVAALIALPLSAVRTASAHATPPVGERVAAAPAVVKPSVQPGAQGARPRCTTADLETGSRQSTVLVGEGATTEMVHKVRGECVAASVVGAFRLADDLEDIASLAPNGHLTIERLTRDGRVAFIADADDRGTITRRYQQDGAEVDGSVAHRWIGPLVRTFVLYGGIGVEQRVAQLRTAGGVSAVLHEISSLSSDGVRRAYFMALLGSSPRLTRAESDLLVRQAAGEIQSSGDLRAVLERASSSALVSRRELGAAIGNMSSGDRRAVLMRNIVGADEATLRMILEGAMSMSSSGDKASVLYKATPGVGRHPSLQRLFLQAASTLSSSGDMSTVIKGAVQEWPRADQTSIDLANATTLITSDGDRTTVLLAMVKDGLVTPRARAAFMKAARTLTDGSYRVVMDELLK